MTEKFVSSQELEWSNSFTDAAVAFDNADLIKSLETMNINEAIDKV